MKTVYFLVPNLKFNIFLARKFQNYVFWREFCVFSVFCYALKSVIFAHCAAPETHVLWKDQLKKKSGSVVMDRNKIQWNNEGMEIQSTTPEHEVWGDDEPLNKRKKK